MENKIIERGEQEYKNLDWIYHDNVAYLFPKPHTVSVKMILLLALGGE